MKGEWALIKFQHEVNHTLKFYILPYNLLSKKNHSLIVIIFLDYNMWSELKTLITRVIQSWYHPSGSLRLTVKRNKQVKNVKSSLNLQKIHSTNIIWKAIDISYCIKSIYSKIDFVKNY